MVRRALLIALLSLPLVLVTSEVWSGSYLNRAALLLDGARADRDMVLPRANDVELLRVVYDVAQARSASARNMDVPKAIAAAHPHLLLVLANCERAYAAALDGHHDRFIDHIMRARAEDTTFRALIKKMGYTLPPTSAHAR